jgi:hypothetical protein
VRRASVIAKQDPARVVLHDVVSNSRMIDARKMDPFTAIKSLRRLKCRLAGTCLGRDESLVVVDYLVLKNGDKRRICYKDSLKVGILDCEPCDHNPVKPGIVQPIDVDTVGFVQRVDNGSTRTGTHQ